MDRDVARIKLELDNISAALNTALREEHELHALRMGEMIGDHDFKTRPVGPSKGSRYHKALESLTVIREALDLEDE